MLIAIFLLSFLLLDIQGVSAKLAVSDYIINYKVVLDSVSVTIKWIPTADTRNFNISRKLKNSTSYWATLASIEDTTIKSWRDTTIEIGKEYEYKLIQNKTENTAFAYFVTGKDVPLKEFRGSLLLLIDSTIYENLSSEITQLVEDIIGDGWRVHLRCVPRAEKFDKAKVNIVANIIKETIAADSNLRTLFLLGRVPVPYSGNNAIDGHTPQHVGAWPCDGYYQSLYTKGVNTMFGWSDNSVDSKVATDARNWNEIGDGKFDNSVFPYDLKLECGRVDMYNLPAFQLSEEVLLRRYLQQNHKYRNNLVSYKRQAVVNDAFGIYPNEVFAPNGWMMFGATVGIERIDTTSMASVLRTNNYLFAYGSGGGSYTSCSKVANTADIVKKGGYRTVFSFIFGSWFGDWDSENNLMRTLLAADPPALTCAWAARPYWFIHHLATDENIGYSARITQNNSASGIYTSNSVYGHRGTHIALLGDPTLRVYTVPPVENLSATLCGNVDEPATLEVKLQWDKKDDDILGYNVYRAKKIEDVFVRLNDTLIKECEFFDKKILLDSSIYQVRAVAKEKNFSATYFTQSTGKFVKIKTISNIENDKEVTAYVFPNPIENHFSVFIYGQQNNEITINLYDLSGRNYGQIYNGTMLSKDLVLNFNINNMVLNKNLLLENGVYFLKLHQGATDISIPLVIRK